MDIIAQWKKIEEITNDTVVADKLKAGDKIVKGLGEYQYGTNALDSKVSDKDQNFKNGLLVLYSLCVMVN